MCGRFSLSAPDEELATYFALAVAPTGLRPRFNVAPTQEAAIVRAGPRGGGRRLEMAKWGLVPGWAKDPAIGARMINARAETAAGKPSFRSAMRKRRCLVPADGFFEWRRAADGKQPIHFRRPAGGVFAMAGLWEHWSAPDAETSLETFTILTTSANPVVAPVHDRMPVVLDPADFDLWLDPEMQDAARVEGLLRPCPEGWVEGRAVSTRVNNPRNDDPGCVEPVA